MEYELLMLEEDRAHFRFSGLFKGVSVTWDVWLEALEKSEEHPVKQSMDITFDAHKNRVRATLQLAIGHVSESEIHKSIIMIRNYKNMGTGTHKWCG